MIKPVLHRILIKPTEVQETDEVLRRARAVGIEIQLDKREEKAVEIGTVCALGSTVYREFGTTAEQEGITVGSTVSFAKYAGKELFIDGDRYLMINDEDVIGVFE